MDAALLASYTLMGLPTTRAVRLQTPISGTESLSAVQTLDTPRPQTPQSSSVRPAAPATHSAPRKRSLSDQYPITALTCHGLTRAMANTAKSRPYKSNRCRTKKLIPLDQAICIPMHVLRAQKEDASALLRPTPKPSDRLRKLVDMSIENTLEKLRTPNGTGILEAAVRSPKKRVEGNEEAAAGSPAKKRRS